MSEAIDAMRDMVGRHLAMGLKARMEAQINMVESELRERDERISELKSLVRDMWLNSERGRYGICGTCRHECEYASDGCEIERRMAELGVEVER